MKMTLKYEDEVSQVFKTSNDNEFYILRNKEFVKNDFDETQEEFWVEIREEMGFYYLKIESDNIDEPHADPYKALKSGWLLYPELCALPIDIEGQCEKCKQSLDLKDIEKSTLTLSWKTAHTYHIDCENDTRSQLVEAP